MSTTVTVPTTVYQSRWGFHPVNREDFLILKALHKRWWLAFFMANKWARWGRKASHNRLGPQPPLDPGVHDLKQAERFLEVVKNGCLSGYSLSVPKALQYIVCDFGEARMPKVTAEEVKPLDMAPYRELWAKMNV